MSNVQADLALNSTECVKTASHFGYSEITNICSGAKNIIEWGGVDWLAFLGISIFLSTVIALFIGMAVSMIRKP